MRINRYAAGITNIDSSGAVIMPPTIGAAMRCMTSEPVPSPHMIGSRPAMITATVIALGRTRSTAPSRIASSNVTGCQRDCLLESRVDPRRASGRAA